MKRVLCVATHVMTGNTGIQLAVAYILNHYLRFDKIEIHDIHKIELKDMIQDYGDIFQCTEKLWPLIYPSLGNTLPPDYADAQHMSLYLIGYFQDLVPLIQHREFLLETFRTDSTVISQGGYTMAEFATAPPPLELDSEDIVLHMRFGDYVGNQMVIDPVPQLAILRAAMTKRLIIVCRKPATAIEENYIKIFEEFHPILQHGTELEDFAVLRAANRIMVTNSTFSWLAAFLGEAKQRWIPVPTYNTLGKISDGDRLYEARNGYPIEELAIPTNLFLPVTGEFFQGMCDYTITNKALQKSFADTGYYIIHPPEKQLCIEDSWPEKSFEATSLFIYPTADGSIARHVFKASWPNLRLIVFHNSDYGVDYESVIPFLNANPGVQCWAQNSTQWHPRIKPIPIGEENRFWRGGKADYEPIVAMGGADVRDINILAAYWSNTNPVRSVWLEQIKQRTDTSILYRIQKGDYLERVGECRALVCPPGNGVDTHRHWDALRAGAWAIVEDNGHTRALMKEYPSLHLIPVKDMTSPIEIPEGIPFHPMLLRFYWETLFRSFL